MKLFGSNEQLPFLTADQKRLMIEQETPFAIQNVKYRAAGTFGPSWLLTITIMNDSADQGLITFKSDMYRDQEMEALREYLYKEEFYGPVKLGTKPSKKKGYQPTIVIVDIEEVVKEEAPF